MEIAIIVADEFVVVSICTFVSVQTGKLIVWYCCLFFRNAVRLNPDRMKIKGSVCGVKIEEIQEPLMWKIRYLDKLVDELAKGKPIDRALNNRKGRMNLFPFYFHGLHLFFGCSESLSV